MTNVLYVGVEFEISAEKTNCCSSCLKKHSVERWSNQCISRSGRTQDCPLSQTRNGRSFVFIFKDKGSWSVALFRLYRDIFNKRPRMHYVIEVKSGFCRLLMTAWPSRLNYLHKTQIWTQQAQAMFSYFVTKECMCECMLCIKKTTEVIFEGFP